MAQPIALALFTTIMLGSCATNKHSISITENNTAPVNTSVFVEMKDGSIQYFKSLRLVTGVFRSPHLLADDHKKFSADDLRAYQNHEHYAISQSEISNGRRSFVAVETLPGFAVRTVTGRINVYCKKFYNGRAAVNEYFLQEGENGQILVYTPELMKTMIKDNHEAFSYFLTGKENNVEKKLQTTIELYNNASMNQQTETTSTK
jgi:hypothetical protein